MPVSRILLKLSGEALLGPSNTFPYDPSTLDRIAHEIKMAHDKGVEIGVVLGGGNIFRGANGASHGMDRTEADNFGMLATVQNGIVLRDLLKRCHRVETRLMSGVEIRAVGEPYIIQRARRHLEKGRVILLVGGTGHPYCTTDYAAALRACETQAGVIFKATNTDGVYDKDPRKHGDAKRLSRVSYNRCIHDDLHVMDTEAFALCRTQRIPIRVFSLLEEGAITAALTGADIGSLVTSEEVVA
ncbi:UMP kinase [Candidatus Uhrbacteria bacterium]|nr:UMP kinase [Candidatus Uhrbacteria bacterium]